MSDKRKVSLYFPTEMMEEIRREAKRLDRSVSWVIQRAWKGSRFEMFQLPDQE